MKRKKWTVLPWFGIFTAAMLFMSIASYNYNPVLSCIELGITAASGAVVLLLCVKFRSYVSGIAKTAAEKISGRGTDYLEKYHYPVAVVGENGEIVWCNSRFRRQICGSRSPEGDSLEEYLSGARLSDMIDADGVDVAAEGREYTAYCTSTGDGSAVCSFIDNTYYKATVREFYATRPCVAIVTFDNAEDFESGTDEDYTKAIVGVESLLQKFAADYNALYKKLSVNRYLFVFRDCDVERLINAKFPILKQIHSVKSNRIEATISGGLCRGASTVKESEALARKALEMALGRGGDQFAVISNNNFEFFGGTAAASEKMSRVRMRVISNAIRKAIEESEKVIIMGHRFSDLDCVGAAIGMQRVIEKTFRRPCKIVINKETSMAKKLISYAEENISDNIFITADEAERSVNANSLLVVVDTHIRSSLESPELYDMIRNVIVIDHHRKAVNFIENTLVFCHEPSASSACEMCSEIISYLGDKELGNTEADALLAGITLDTKNFVLKTGVRTFEAAAYLRKKGADTLTVKRLFADSIDTYREKVDIVCRADIHNGCAVSIAQSRSESVRLAAAQAADELLTLEGVNASFVIFEGGGKINISARSFGSVNVQILMEALGGGGHQTMAATQLAGTTSELAYKKLLSVIDEKLEDVSD